MSTYWRIAGLKIVNSMQARSGLRISGLSSFTPRVYDYINYSHIAAKTLRHSLKSDLKAEALKRDESGITYNYWSQGAMLPLGQKPVKKEKEKQ